MCCYRFNQQGVYFQATTYRFLFIHRGLCFMLQIALLFLIESALLTRFSYMNKRTILKTKQWQGSYFEYLPLSKLVNIALVVFSVVCLTGIYILHLCVNRNFGSKSLQSRFPRRTGKVMLSLTKQIKYQQISVIN